MGIFLDGASGTRAPIDRAPVRMPALRTEMLELVIARPGAQVSSTVGADGPFSLQEAIPFSIAEVDEYISLFPMTAPLDALSTKYG